MLRLSLAMIAVAAVFAAPAAEATSKPKSTSRICATKTDMQALNMRVLQTELMVAALSCDERERYNNFILSNRPILTRRSRELQSFFSRSYGTRGTFQLNEFITRIANSASQHSQTRTDDYCQFASTLFERALTPAVPDVAVLIAEPWVAERHEVPPCS